jgi:hypothetical protein
VTATETPPISADLSDLCELVMARDVVPVAELLATGKDHSLLAKALAKGLLVIGRQSYAEILADAKPRLKAGKQEFDPETKRPIVDRTVEIRLEKDWSWTGLPPGRKSLRELLDEEAALPPDVPRLHVKITTDGMAAIN